MFAAARLQKRPRFEIFELQQPEFWESTFRSNVSCYIAFDIVVEGGILIFYCVAGQIHYRFLIRYFEGWTTKFVLLLVLAIPGHSEELQIVIS